MSGAPSPTLAGGQNKSPMTRESVIASRRKESRAPPSSPRLLLVRSERLRLDCRDAWFLMARQAFPPDLLARALPGVVQASVELSSDDVGSRGQVNVSLELTGADGTS